MSQTRENTQISFECPISGNIMEKPVITSCGHTFEEESIKEWINHSSKTDAKGNCVNTCPCCSEQVSIPELRRNYQLQAVLPFIKKQQTENAVLKTKLASLELLHIAEDKSDRAPTALERDLNQAQHTVTAINHLQEKQQQLLVERKALIKTDVPIIKEAYKKLAYIKQRLKFLENKSSDENMMDLSELDSDMKKQFEKYQTFHQQQATKTRTELVEPYLKKLETLNNSISKNENDLRTLKTARLKTIEKSATRSRLMSAVSTSIFGGTPKFKQLMASQKPLEVKKPAEVKQPEASAKPAIKIIERAKQTQILMRAVEDRSTEQALIALQKGANPNFTTEGGVPFIISATKANNSNLVAVLLEYKANVNVTDANRSTALHWAAYYCLVPMVLTLLENGADPRILSAQNITAAGETDNLLIRDTINQTIQEFNAKERLILRP